MIGKIFPADRIFEKSENLRFSKNQGLVFFENPRFSDFSKIRPARKKIPIIKKNFFSQSQNYIERPFRNTQQHILTPPDRGERALSSWVEIKNFMKILNRPLGLSGRFSMGSRVRAHRAPSYIDRR